MYKDWMRLAFGNPMSALPTNNNSDTTQNLMNTYKEGVYNNHTLASLPGANNQINTLLGLKTLDLYDKQLSTFNQNQNSFVNNYIKPGMSIINGLSSLGSIYLGFQGLGLAKKQLGIAQEQWNTTKQELSRINNVRTKLTKQYMS